MGSGGLNPSGNFRRMKYSTIKNLHLGWIAPAIFFSVAPLFSAPIAGWNVSSLPGGAGNFGPSPLASTIADPNVTVVGLTRGSGVTTINSGAARGWGGNGWLSASAAAAATANQFATFSITANAGFATSFSSISKFDYRRSGTGAASGVLQYQLGGGPFNDVTTISYSDSTSTGGSISPIDLSGVTDLQNVVAGTTVTFRIVNFGGTSSGGTWYIFDVANTTATDFQVDGTVSTLGGAPLATSFAPLDNATGVSTTATLSVTFNEPIQKGSGDILIKHSADSTVFETIPVSSSQVVVSGSTVTITPTAPFSTSTGYYVEVAPGAFEDAVGNDHAGISGNSTWNFTTVAAADTTAPLATAFAPLDDATGVPPTTGPSVTFDEPVQQGTGDILIKRSADNTTFATLPVMSEQVGVSGNTITLNPTTPFDDSTGYYVEIPPGAIEDLSGNDYIGTSGSSQWNFTTGVTLPAFTATKTLFASGAAKLSGGFPSSDYYAEGKDIASFAVYSLASFKFSKVDFLLPGSASIDDITSAEYSLTTNNRTFAAGTELEFFLTTDQLNGSFTGKSFNTAFVNGIDNTQYSFAPISLGKFPYVPATTSAQGGLINTFQLNLSAATLEPAFIAQLNAGAEFSIILAATTPTAAITYSGMGNTFDPGDPSLKLTVTRTIGTDATPPLVEAFTPADGFSGHPLSANLSIRFNELVQKGTGSISIFRASDNALVESIDATSSQVTVNAATVTIDPTAPLVSGNTYYVQISPAAIEDVSGNDYAGITDSTTWDFTTSQPPITALGPFNASENAPAGTVVGDLNPSIIGNEGVRYAILGGSGGSTLMKGVPGAGYLVNPVFTIGDTLEATTGALNSSTAGNYTPPGTPDGLGAFSLNANTVRVFMNHEIEVPNSGSAGGSYTLANGTVMAKGGARVSYFDIDKASRRVVDGGLAIARIYDRSGNVVTNPSQLEMGGLDRMCSASLYEPDLFGAGRGLTDRIYLTGEETSTAFGHPYGGTFWALDVSNGDFWALPDLGRGSWENAALVDTGTTTHVAFLLGDDAQSTPLYLYLGTKDAAPGANFLQRNGLSNGQLYVWKADNGNLSPQQFNGTGAVRAGTWIPLDARAAAASASTDPAGYKKDSVLHSEADALGAFSFSRPEDLSTSPTDGSMVAFASTGRGSLYPLDNWGDTYIVDLDFANLGTASPLTASIRILYSGDDAGNGQFMSPENGLRCPDNLDWADDGFIYVQEDQSNQQGDFGAAGEETSIWRLDSTTGQATRVAQIDRGTVLPLGASDGKVGDFGNWESSGIIDVSTLFGEAPGQLFLFDVQAHSITTGLIASKNLYEGGQLCFLEKGLEKGSFAINPNSGVITIANPDAISLDHQLHHELRIQAFDGTNTSLKQVSVNITNTPFSKSNNFKVASYNTSLYRDTSGALINELATVTSAQPAHIARVIQRNNADVILINEFDYDAGGKALKRFKENYLEVAQLGEKPVYYPYAFIAPANTGVHSGFDLDNNGKIVSTPGAAGYGEDAFGFGVHPGQYSFVVLSKFPIDTANIRTFQKFLWKDMPGALLPDDPRSDGPADWYSPAELDAFRLSSKNHADVPVLVNGVPVHILASHPTPPVFDEGAPWIAGVDHNGRRNSDEIRFWSDYVTPGSTSSYIYDDTETPVAAGGGLPANTRFVICGDQNADNNEGDSTDPAIKQIIGGIVNGQTIPGNPLVNSTFVPAGGSGPQPDDTAAFSGGVRVDYALPSAFGLTVDSGGVFWPPNSDPIDVSVDATDHHMVFLNLSLSGVQLPPSTNLLTYYQPAVGFTGNTLQTKLQDIIDNHVVVEYNDADEIMQVIDEAANDISKVRLIYSIANLPKSAYIGNGGSNATSWNREHVWPRNDGVGQDGPDFSDLHHLFPCQVNVNSLRSAFPFDEGTDLEHDPFAPESFLDEDSWEPLDRDKGLVARAVLYMMTRYDGSDPLTTDLVLNNNPGFAGTDMGVLNTMLAWNRAHPPTDYEKSRNNAIYAGVTVGTVTFAQGNRNPFTDFPQFADAMLLDGNTNSFLKWQYGKFSLADLQNPSISGNTSDPDGDGRSNYAEFLMNGNPLSGADSPLMVVRNENQLTLTFHRPKGALPEQAYLQSSVTLDGDWTTVPNWQNAPTIITNLGDYERVEYTTTITPQTEDKRFWRVLYQ